MSEEVGSRSSNQGAVRRQRRIFEQSTVYETPSRITIQRSFMPMRVMRLQTWWLKDTRLALLQLLVDRTSMLQATFDHFRTVQLLVHTLRRAWTY